VSNLAALRLQLTRLAVLTFPACDFDIAFGKSSGLPASNSALAKESPAQHITVTVSDDTPAPGVTQARIPVTAVRSRPISEIMDIPLFVPLPATATAAVSVVAAVPVQPQLPLPDSAVSPGPNRTASVSQRRTERAAADELGNSILTVRLLRAKTKVEALLSMTLVRWRVMWVVGFFGFFWFTQYGSGALTMATRHRRPWWASFRTGICCANCSISSSPAPRVCLNI
jgi:hypothetical protein